MTTVQQGAYAEGVAQGCAHERERCAGIARSLAYGDGLAVLQVCESIASAIEMGATVEPVVPSRWRA